MYIMFHLLFSINPFARLGIIHYLASLRFAALQLLMLRAREDEVLHRLLHNMRHLMMLLEQSQREKKSMRWYSRLIPVNVYFLPEPNMSNLDKPSSCTHQELQVCSGLFLSANRSKTNSEWECHGCTTMIGHKRESGRGLNCASMELLTVESRRLAAGLGNVSLAAPSIDR